MNVLVEDIHKHGQLSEPELLPELPESAGDEPTEFPERNDAAVTTGRILTALEGHDYVAPPAVRAKAALSENGILYLTDDARSDVLVRSYIAMLDRRKSLSDGRITPYTEVRIVPYTEIQRLYTASGEATNDTSAGVRRSAEESQVVAMLAEACSCRPKTDHVLRGIPVQN